MAIYSPKVTLWSHVTCALVRPPERMEGMFLRAKANPYNVMGEQRACRNGWRRILRENIEMTIQMPVEAAMQWLCAGTRVFSTIVSSLPSIPSPSDFKVWSVHALLQLPAFFFGLFVCLFVCFLVAVGG